MLKSLFAASIFLTALAAPAIAQPPADLEACLKLSAEITKSENNKLSTLDKAKAEAQYVKFYFKKLNLDSACGQRDFVAAEKIADDIKSSFQLD